MTFNFRTFTKILAEQQGGINLKPGKPYVKHLTEAQVREIFGEIPAAFLMSNILITFEEVEPGSYRLVISETTT